MFNRKIANELNRIAKELVAKRLSVYTKELPPKIVEILKEQNFRKNIIEIEIKDAFRSWSGGDGLRGYYVIVNVLSGRIIDSGVGSWGGSNMFTTNEVDEGKTKQLPPHCIGITGVTGSYNLAMIFTREEDLQFLIPKQKEDVNKSDLEEIEIKVLDVFCSIKPSYRQNEFYHRRLGEYSKNNPFIQSLLEKGLLKEVGTGIQVTPKGKTMMFNS